jgi:hypothetical protein
VVGGVGGCWGVNLVACGALGGGCASAGLEATEPVVLSAYWLGPSGPCSCIKPASSAKRARGLARLQLRFATGGIPSIAVKRTQAWGSGDRCSAQSCTCWASHTGPGDDDDRVPGDIVQRGVYNRRTYGSMVHVPSMSVVEQHCCCRCCLREECCCSRPRMLAP